VNALLPLLLCPAWADVPVVDRALADAGAYAAPAHESSLDGPFGVLFVPRYPDLSMASARRAADLAALSTLAASLDEAGRHEVGARLAARLQAVEHWQEVFLARQADASLPPDRKLALSDVHQALVLEASTLRLQLELVGAPLPAAPAPAVSAPKPGPAPVDRVVFGRTLVVGPGQTVRDAVAFGGDVEIDGTVLHDAVSFGGDVTIRPPGQVLGEAIAFGGEITGLGGGEEPAGTAASVTATALAPSGFALGRGLAALVSFFSLAGMGILTVGLAPHRVQRIAEIADEQPFASGALGLFGSLALLLTAGLFAITFIGIPVALLLLALLGSAWLLGFVGVAQAMGDRLNTERPEHGRWLALIGLALALVVLSELSWWGAALAAAVSAVGAGAALRSRLGVS
jgi:hypothetical protein